MKLIEHALFRSKWRSFYALLAVLVVVKSGIWFIPNLDIYRQVSLNPFSNPFVGNTNAQYLVWSWLGNYLAWILGIKTFGAFFAFHFLLSCAFLVTVALWIRANFNFHAARVVSVIFCSLPVASTSFYWVGMDSLTLFLLSLLLHFYRKPALACLVGVLVGLQHFEQGVFAIAGIFLVVLLEKVVDKSKIRLSVKFVAASLAGVVIGRIVLNVLFTQLSFGLESDRTQLWLSNINGLFQVFVGNLDVTVWSTLACGWLVAFYVISKNTLSMWSVLAILAVGVLAGLMVFDESRVMEIVTFPVFMLFLYKHQDLLEKVRDNTLIAYFAIWLAVPWLWVLGGVTEKSLLLTDLQWVIRWVGLLLGHDIPAPQPSI